MGSATRRDCASERATEGSAERFERISEAYGARLLAYAARRTAVDDVPDVIAETLLTAWRRVGVMPADDEQAFWWLLAIARRVLANHRRGVTRRLALAERVRGTVEVHTRDADPGAPAVDAQTIVQGALSRLSDEDRELVRLVYWDALTIRAAAAVIDTSEATARKRLQRARDRLRDMIGAIEPVEPSPTGAV